MRRDRIVRAITTWAKVLALAAAVAGLMSVAQYLNKRPAPGAQKLDAITGQTFPTSGQFTEPAGETTQTTEQTQEQTQPTQDETQPTDETQETEAETQETEAETQPTVLRDERRLVVIDAGHQAKGNSQKEPDGPGSSTMKAKVSGGTKGVATGLPEYKLNLQVALKLQKVLESRGYQVVMIRTTNDVNISNAERAQQANDMQADAFIRIHANGSEKESANGILTICQTKKNPYNKELHEKSYLLAESVLNEITEETGAKKLYIWETDTMSGINWCQVPTTIVEMGFMTNEEEDRKMATDAYQDKLATGIANGVDRYFDRQ